MFQDIQPHELHNQYQKKRRAEESDYLMVFRQGKIWLKKTAEGFELPRCSLFPEKLHRLQYLLELDETGFFLWQEETLPEEEVYSFESTNVLRSSLPKELAFGAMTAYHLGTWYDTERYCGRCGQRMKPDEKERAQRCTCCGNVVYPRISPGVIVRVTDGDRILLTKYAGREFTNYALIAGFTEIGETLEDTVRREVMEEVGLRVKNIRYYKNQPWAFSQSLLVGFTAELDGDDAITLEEDELSVGVWMTREEMPSRANDISLTAEMMENFRCGRG